MFVLYYISRVATKPEKMITFNKFFQVLTKLEKENSEKIFVFPNLIPIQCV